MSILKRLFSGISPDPIDLEIPPAVTVVRPPKAINTATTLDDASKKHGKPFKAQAKVLRESAPSEQLERLNRLSAEAKAASHPIEVVTDISSRRKL